LVKWYTDWKVRVGWSRGKYRGRSTGGGEGRDIGERKRERKR
jgi:hypothetical protein